MSFSSGDFVPDEKLLRPLEKLLASISSGSSVSSKSTVKAIPHVGVALSGGPDSSVLAIYAAYLARQQHVSVTLLHIHHGLLAQADEWTERVRQLARLLELPLVERFVQVDLTQSRGLEGAAREARHQALRSMAQERALAAVLFAHHLQDQAETVLQRLFRGAGMLGLSAMKSANLVEIGTSSTSQQACWWLRPWLNVSRQRILQSMQKFESVTGWQAVNDPSNLETAYARGVIRSQLAAPIQQHWPAWAENLARHAEHAQQASELLSEYGQLLLQQVGESPSQGAPLVLDLRQWRALTEAQQSLVIRTWLAAGGVRMPTQQRLAELCRQLNHVHAYGHDRALFWQQSDCEVRCLRGKIHLQVTMSGFGSTCDDSGST